MPLIEQVMVLQQEALKSVEDVTSTAELDAWRLRFLARGGAFRAYSVSQGSVVVRGRRIRQRVTIHGGQRLTAYHCKTL